jgi:excisionase family DNA binding protein
MRSDVRSALQPYESLVAPQRYDVEAHPRLRHISPQQARGAAMSRSNSPRPQRDQGQLLDVPAVARRLDVSEKTVRRLIARGELRAHRIGRLLRISEEELGRFLDSSR